MHERNSGAVKIEPAGRMQFAIVVGQQQRMPAPGDELAAGGISAIQNVSAHKANNARKRTPVHAGHPRMATALNL